MFLRMVGEYGPRIALQCTGIEEQRVKICCYDSIHFLIVLSCLQSSYE